MKKYLPVSLLPINEKKKYLIDQCLIKILGFSWKTVWFPHTNLGLSQETPVLTYFYLKSTKYISVLIMGFK